MRLDEFSYDLPKELIAQKPVYPKDSSRLMVVKGQRIEHKTFRDVIDYLEKDDVLVINETKVKRCKLINGKKATGSPAEMFIVEKNDDETYKVRVKAKHPKVGNVIIFNGITAKLIGTYKDMFIAQFDKDAESFIEKNAEYPFPTYIKRDTLSDDEYQPIFAKKIGSVAAPTASLHFTEELLDKIKQKGVKIAKVCLHIDFGTFFEIAEDEVEKHRMHQEYFEVGEEAAKLINECKGRLIAVGTTAVRTLESASDDNGKVHAMKGDTDIYIYPGYKFKSKIKAMITNFHLPKSSLLLLVCGFAGKETILNAYKEAVKQKYRFYSLGDAMFLEKMQPQ